jgi:hypothetical protein
MRHKTVTTKKTTVTGLKDFYTYSLRADLPVVVQTLQGPAEPKIDIRTVGKMVLRGSMNFGDATPLAEANDDAPPAFVPIALSADAMDVTGNVEFVGAVPDIRGKGDVTITVKDPRGRLNAQVTGNITISQVAGKGTPVLKIGQVVAATFGAQDAVQSAGNVTIKALNGINATTYSSRIFGAKVQLDGGEGSIFARVDSAVLGTGGVAARAQGTISIQETLGDMRLITPDAWKADSVSIHSLSADVRLEARHGAILDASYERVTADPVAVAAQIAAAGFTETELRFAGLPTGETMNRLASNPVSPEVMAAIFPHMDLAGTKVTAVAERLNVQGRNVTLISQSANGGIGRSTERTTIIDPTRLERQPEYMLAVLSKAAPRDIESVNYQRYEWLGETTTLDLESEVTYLTGSWRAVDATEDLPETMHLLASTDGVQEVRTGQWVENRWEVLSVVVQVWDDVNVSASGEVAIDSAGDVIVAFAGDVRVRDVADLEKSGVTSGPGRSSRKAVTTALMPRVVWLCCAVPATCF